MNRNELKNLTAEEYNILLDSGMLFEWYPDATGNIGEDIVNPRVESEINKIDDFNFYPTALSESDIKDLYAQSTSASDSSMEPKFGSDIYSSIKYMMVSIMISEVDGVIDLYTTLIEDLDTKLELSSPQITPQLGEEFRLEYDALYEKYTKSNLKIREGYSEILEIYTHIKQKLIKQIEGLK